MKTYRLDMQYQWKESNKTHLKTGYCTITLKNVGKKGKKNKEIMHVTGPPLPVAHLFSQVYSVS